MDAKNPHGHGPTDAKGIASHVVMFWVLAGMALAVFAPAVLLPVWVESEGIREQKQELAASNGDLETQAQDNQACIEALLADPVVNERIIRRELNYRLESEEIVQWSPAMSETARFEFCGSDILSEERAVSDPQPGWIAVIHPWLPDWPWRELFVKSPNREMLLLLAGGLLVAAFVLYAPKPKSGT
jgi:hypothetical protein